MNKKIAKQEHLSLKEDVDAEREIYLARGAITIGSASLIASIALTGCRGTTTTMRAGQRANATSELTGAIIP